MELTDYDITFIHIKGINKILADAIFKLKMLDIYKLKSHRLVKYNTMQR